MKHITFTLVIVCALGAALHFSGVRLSRDVHAASLAGAVRQDETEEIRRNYQLNPGAEVRVSGFNGPVTIETSEGATADIHIERRARSQAAFERRPVVIEAAPGLLIIRTENDREEGDKRWGRDNPRDRVMLKLPRQIALAVKGINGPVNVAAITGKAEVSGVNGSVTFTEAASFSNISGINGKVSVGMTRIGAGGLKISGVNGAVECRINGDVNAELRASGINGTVQLNIPNAVLTGELSRNRVNATIGSGGPLISVSGVNGSVRFNPAG